MRLILVLCVIFLDHVGLGLVYPIFSSLLFRPEMTFVDPEMSNTARGMILGLLLSTPAVSSFFSSPILGALSDQKGRRPIYLFSIAVAVCGYCLCMLGVWMHSVLLLVFARAIVGVSMGNGSVVSATIVDLSTEHNKAKNFGLFCTASGIGFATGPFLGGWLATYGVLVPFFVAGVAVFINLVVMIFYFQETNLAKTIAPVDWKRGLLNLKKAFQIQELRTLFIVVAFFCFGWSLFYEFLPVIWMSDYGCSLKEVGFFFAFGSAVFALSSGLFIQPIVERFSAVSVLACSLLGAACCMFIPILRPATHWIWLYVGAANLLVSMTFPTYTTVVSDSASKDAQGEVLGILEAVQATAFGIGPLVAGSLVGIHLHMPVVFASACTALAALLLMLGWRKRSVVATSLVSV